MSEPSWLFNPQTEGQQKVLADFEESVARREEMLQTGALSLPSRQGILLIIASGRTAKTSPLSPDEQISAFREEADRLAIEREGQHSDVQVVKRADPREIRLALANPEISDLILIGHGNIARIWTEKRGDFSWLKVAQAVTHLKQGKFEQRMCGHLGNTGGAVPLGTFAVSELGNVTAAVGIAEVPDANPPNKLFVPAFERGSTLSVLEQVRQLNLQVPSDYPARAA